MRPISTLLTILAGLLALYAHGAATLPLPTAAEAVSAPARAASCAEDDPCWNWAKDGNHRRGVVTLDGDPLVVGPCGFNRLWAHGAIRHRIDGRPMIKRLRGDRFARTLTDCPWRIREGRPYPWHQSPGRFAVKRGY